MVSNPSACKGHAGYSHGGSLPAARKTQVAAGKETELPWISSWHRQGSWARGELSVFCCLKDVALIVAEKELVLCLYFF